MSDLSLAAQAALIGKCAVLRTGEGLCLPVIITNVKHAWGCQRYVVSDEFGNTATVDALRVQVTAQP